MKNVILKSIILGALVVFFASCANKDSADKTFITDYPKYDIQGDNPAIVAVGEPYEDAGVIATLDGQNVTSKITVNNSVDYETMGMYTVEYSYVNKDGFRSSANRVVFVCNPSVTTDISGKYVTQEGTERVALASGAETPYAGYHATITYIAPGFFQIDDFFGGYYAERQYPDYGYGIMGMGGYLALNEDNSIDMISSYISAWGNSLDELDNGQYDPSTGEITWDAYWNGYTYMFHVVLK